MSVSGRSWGGRAGAQLSPRLALKLEPFAHLLKPAAGYVVQHAGKSNTGTTRSFGLHTTGTKAMSSMGNMGQQFVHTSLEKAIQI